LIVQNHLLAGVDGAQIALLPIVPYFKMIGLIGSSACVLTDASTVQEETTILGIPCLTLHNYTERRITVEQGTNIAVGCNSSLIHRAIAEIMRGGGKKGRLPKFWDGMTANRMAEHLAAWWKQKAPRAQEVETP
jgi:UDP-N-acetylglucosamine 2-epimerase (non-hydrolysing)